MAAEQKAVTEAGKATTISDLLLFEVAVATRADPSPNTSRKTGTAASDIATDDFLALGLIALGAVLLWEQAGSLLAFFA